MASTDEFLFRSQTLSGSICDALKRMRSNDEFCDITFQIGNRCISAHRVIIAAAIPYFRETLSNKASENEEIKDVLLDIDSEAFERLIEFAYTSEINITENNVKNLLYGAQHLKIDEVREACCDFLTDHLNPENVSDIRDLACKLNHQELAENVDCYCEENFEVISESEDFVNYSLPFVEKLLGSSDLRVSSEEKVFEALMRWIKKHPEGRKEELPQLMMKVRMSLLNPRYLRDIVSNESLIKESLSCRDLLDEAKNFHFFPENRPDLCNFSLEPRFLERVSGNGFSESRRQVVILYADATYGYQRVYTNKCVFNAPHDKNPMKLISSGSKTFPYYSGTSAELNDKIYLFTEHEVLEYCPARNLFKSRLSATSGRSFSGAVAVDNKIYICGGRLGSSVSNVVNCYDPGKNEWIDMKSMRFCRSSPSVSELWGDIYVIGGRGTTCSLLSSVERLNPRIKQWKTVSPLLTARCALSSATINCRIYACGGLVLINGRLHCSSVVEVYDPIVNQWTYVSSMNLARCHLKLLAFDGKLFARGGLINLTPQNAVEIYYPQSNEWKEGNSTKSNSFIIALGSFDAPPSIET